MKDSKTPEKPEDNRGKAKKYSKQSAQGMSYNSQKLLNNFGFRKHRKLKLFFLFMILVAIGVVYAWSYLSENSDIQLPFATSIIVNIF